MSFKYESFFRKITIVLRAFSATFIGLFVVALLALLYLGLFTGWPLGTICPSPTQGQILNTITYFLGEDVTNQAYSIEYSRDSEGGFDYTPPTYIRFLVDHKDIPLIKGKYEWQKILENEEHIPIGSLPENYDLCMSDCNDIAKRFKIKSFKPTYAYKPNQAVIILDDSQNPFLSVYIRARFLQPESPRDQSGQPVIVPIPGSDGTPHKKFLAE